MDIQEEYKNMDLIKYETVQEVSQDGSIISRKTPILTEHFIAVYVNEKLMLKISCTPQYLAELLLGRILTEGIIKKADEVRSVHISESGGCGRIILKSGRLHAKPDVSFENIPPIEPVPWKNEWIFALAGRFAQGMPLHQETRAAHSCFLSREGEFLFGCEDIGRHNALDKVIGFALRNQIDLRKCAVYLSGRIPKDMVMKAVRAHIPVLAAKASPTWEALHLARKYGLTLIYAARQDSMKISRQRD